MLQIFYSAKIVSNFISTKIVWNFLSAFVLKFPFCEKRFSLHKSVVNRKHSVLERHIIIFLTRNFAWTLSLAYCGNKTYFQAMHLKSPEFSKTGETGSLVQIKFLLIPAVKRLKKTLPLLVSIKCSYCDMNMLLYGLDKGNTVPFQLYYCLVKFTLLCRIIPWFIANFTNQFRFGFSMKFAKNQLRLRFITWLFL